jgi:hypothetical protein
MKLMNGVKKSTTFQSAPKVFYARSNSVTAIVGETSAEMLGIRKDEQNWGGCFWV